MPSKPAGWNCRQPSPIVRPALTGNPVGQTTGIEPMSRKHSLSSPHSEAAPPTSSRPVILIVEDEEDTRVLLTMCLENHGFTTLSVASASAASDRVRQGGIDLVLLDWNLNKAQPPGMGSEVLAVCRDVDRLLPVIVISGLPPSQVDVRTDSLSQSANSFYPKPFTIDGLVKHIRFMLEVRRSSSLVRLSAESDIVRMEVLECLYARAVVELLDGNVSRAAKRLGIHRDTLSKLLERGRNAPKVDPITQPGGPEQHP